MNFLAHLALAPDDAPHHLGAILGDFVRGSDLSAWPPAVESGIRLHRAIDAATDAGTVLSTGRKLLAPARQRFAGLVVDIFFDHFLARDWTRWQPGESLPDWTQRVQQRLQRQPASLLGGDARQLVDTMVDQCWLTDYASIDGMSRAMTRLSRRRPFLAPLAGAEDDLVASHAQFQALFASLYPRLQSLVAAWPAVPPRT